MIRPNHLCIVLIVLLMSCSHGHDTAVAADFVQIKDGHWLLKLDLHEGVTLPVDLMIDSHGEGSIAFINGDETLTATLERSGKDSMRISMPYFDSEFIAKISEDGSTFSGKWLNRFKGPDYAIPFIAHYGEMPRFCSSESENQALAGRYEIHFSPNSVSDQYPAVGMFTVHPDNHTVLGTFVTETGDYRYLEGNICQDDLFFSCFDGSHAFLFKAKIQGDSLVNGQFYSGTHWQEDWLGVISTDFNLRDPYSLTHVVDSSAVDSTRFTLQDGSYITLCELRKPNEVVILQVMGSWCPNCLDESAFFKDLHDSYSSLGLRVLPLCFEASTDYKEAYRAIHKLETDLELPYPMYYGGSRQKSDASAALPALEHIMSYPTSIFIDRHGKVRSVHTGFYGPSTGIYYEQYTVATRALVKGLLSEN